MLPTNAQRASHSGAMTTGFTICRRWTHQRDVVADLIILAAMDQTAVRHAHGATTIATAYRLLRYIIQKYTKQNIQFITNPQWVRTGTPQPAVGASAIPLLKL